MDEASTLRGRWYAEGWYGTDTLAHALRAGAAAHPEATLSFMGDERESSATLPEVLQRAENVASALHARGIDAGDVIAVQVPNWVEGAVAYAAAMLLGAVVVPIVHIYGPAEVGFILRQARASALVVPDRWRNIDFLKRLDDTPEVHALETIVVIGDDVPPPWTPWALLEAGSAVALPRLEQSADDPAFLVYTSGTTGTPKGVLHSHNTLLAELRVAQDIGTNTPGRVTLGSFPAGHIAGVLSLLRCFVSGSTSVLLDAWDPTLAARMVERYRPESTAGTPYFLTSLIEAADAGGFDISSLRSFLVGAANVPPSVVALAQEHGIAAYRSYGSTEHPTVTTGVPMESSGERANTDGALAPGNELRIVDDDGRDLPEGSPGEILTRGPELFLGYSDPAFNADAFVDGTWFRAGDIGIFERGRLTIVDRKKDIIIRGGENISSKEVEDLLVLHPAIADAAAVAAPHPRHGETVCAFVVLRAGATVELKDIQEHFERAGLARQKTPERLVIVDELPRGQGGKVQKVELRKRLTTDDRSAT